MSIQPSSPAIGRLPQPGGLKQAMLRGACAALAFYFRRVPLTAGKQWVWDHVMRPYVNWRRLDLVATTRFGARIHGALPDAILRSLYFFGVWEPAITRHVSRLLRPGDTVIDIGGNIGAHALLFSYLVGPSGAVHTIEASPSIFRRLKANLDANNARNVTAYHVAVSDKAGQVTVFLHDESNIGATTIVAREAAKASASAEATVEARRLQDILPPDTIRTAKLLKIDVEGAEWLVLQGIRDLLPDLAPKAEILLELNADALAGFGASTADVVALFREAGFSAYQIENDYGPGAYISQQEPQLRPLPDHHGPLIDVVMRRQP